MKSILIGLIGIALLSNSALQERSTPPSLQNATPNTTRNAIPQNALSNAGNANTAKERIQKKSLASEAGSDNEYKKYAAAFDSLNLTLHPGTRHREDSISTARDEELCKAVVYKTLAAVPNDHAELVKELTLYYTIDGRRGLASKNLMILRCLNIGEKELASVLVHEIGHMIDAALKGSRYPSEFEDFGEPVPEDDPSVQFYRISWLTSERQLAESSPLDFISGYARTDPFEDFAESYVYYLLHGPEFRSLALGNAKLARKYDFLKDFVFAGNEFDLDAPFTATRAFRLYRNYDATALNFDLEKFYGRGPDRAQTANRPES